MALTPLRFRKRPVEIEAMQFTEDSKDRLLHWVGCSGYADVDGEDKPILVIETLEGDHTARLEDWIVKGVNGEFYPVKPDIFEATYEPAAAGPPELRGTAEAPGTANDSVLA